MLSRRNRHLLIAALVIALSPLRAFSGVMTDGSMGAKTTINKAGNDFAIPHTLGSPVGENLFHSLSKFDLATGETATFSGPGGITNILARVTGGPSLIDGTIRSTIPGANFYLLNPNGIAFGSSAALDVSGAVTISTAEKIHFADGKALSSATATTNEPLTSAPVSAFGFGPQPASVRFTQSFIDRPEGSVLNVIAGDVTLDETTVSAPSGTLTIFSAASKGTLPFDPINPGAGHAAAAFAAFGTTDIRTASQVYIDGAGGGRIVIRAGRLLVTGGSSITAYNSGAGRGGDIQVRADFASLTESSFIRVSADSEGAGGDLNVHAGLLQMTSDGAAIANESTFGGGPAGNLNLRVDGAAELRSGAKISSTSSSERGSGALTMSAGSLLLDRAGILSDRGVPESPTGETFATRSGLVRLDIRGTLRIANGGFISATTTSPGAAADLEVTAAKLQIEGSKQGLATGIRADVDLDATGHGGDLSIHSGDLVVTGGGFISASTFGPGDSGILRVHAQGTIDLRDGASVSAATYGPGDAGEFNLSSGRSVELRNGGVLVAATQGRGNAGSLSIQTPRLLVDGRGAGDGTITGIVAQSKGPRDGRPGSITVATSMLTMLGGAVIEATTGSSNDAGSISVSADRILLDGSGAAFLPGAGLPLATAISARTLAGSTGNGGNVSVTARDSITLLNRGEIEAATEARGTGGDVLVRAARLNASGASFGFPSGVIARGADGSTGAAGSVRVEVTGALTLTDRSAIASNNIGAGAAGSVHVSAGREIALTDGATITAASRASDAGTVFVTSAEKITLAGGSDITASAGADGGNIFLQARDLLYLSNSRIVAEAGTVPRSTGAAATGGNIEIDPEFVILDHSTISANAALGRGGNVFLEARNFLSSATPITATGSTAGTVEIAAPELDLSAALAALAASFVDTSLRLQERCVMRLGVEVSSFLAIGRGGVEAVPEEVPAQIVARVRRPGTGKVRAR